MFSANLMRHCTARLAAALLLAVALLSISPALALAQIELSGTLLQADGLPMTASRLVVQNGPDDTSLVVPVDADGRFAFTLDEPGGYGLYATGLHHETLQMPLILTDQKKVALHIRLQAHTFALAPDTLYAVLGASDKAIRMQRQPDETFAVRLEAYADTLAYRIRYGFEASEFSSNKMVAGTMHDRLVFNDSGPFWDSEGDFFSVVDVKGDPFVDITFDPTVLPQRALDPTVGSDPPVIARIASIYLDVEERERRIGSAGNFIHHIFVANRERRAIRKQIAREQEALVRQWLLLRYFDELLPALPIGGKRLAREALESIPTDSPLWSYEAWSPVGASNIMYLIARKLKGEELLNSYVRRIIEEHPDPAVRAQFLYHGVYRAHHEGDERTKWLYFSILQDSHADTRQAEWAHRSFGLDRALQAGNAVPQFSFVSFDDPAVTITNTGLSGQMYLLDFWGTWCSPCIKEIPYLEEAYDQYKASGFEIVSIAFRDDPTDIEQFRKDRHPMPWLHTRVARKDDEAVKALFEITGIPRPILVGEDGIILAADRDLLDGKLLDVLAALYDGAE